jgi:hypothetical protein
MPLVGEFHQKYWNLSDTNLPPVHIGKGGYPVWQASVITPSLLGMIGAWIDSKIALYRWWKPLLRRIAALDREQRAVWLLTLDALEQPAYRAAQTAVRQTATTLGFNRPEAWTELSREVKSSPAKAENNYRHLLAVRKVDTMLREQGSTLTNPELNLTTELAYHGFARVR